MPRGRKRSAVLPNDPMLLNAMLEGLELQKQRLDVQISSVRAALGKGRPGRPPAVAATVVTAVAEPASASAPARRKRKPLSAAARKAIAAAQKKRWAEFRKKKEGE